METTKICCKNNIYNCKFCKYITSRFYDYKKHLQTNKHKNKVNTKKELNKLSIYMCEICNKQYKTRNGLWKHNKKCNNEKIKEENEKNNNENEELMNMVKSLIKENKELQNMLVKQNDENKKLQDQIMELAKTPKIINNNIKTQNNFNILQYLNDECKDAMNLSEFVKNLPITFNDLLLLKSQGIFYSFKNTFIKSLVDLEENKRPIHCSDKKRKKFYVKDEDVWDKDDENKKIKGAINKVSLKHCEVLKNWKDVHPDWCSNEMKQESVNKITSELGKIYEGREKVKIINELTHFNIEKNV
jgi:hypothetical protein